MHEELIYVPFKGPSCIFYSFHKTTGRHLLMIVAQSVGSIIIFIFPTWFPLDLFNNNKGEDYARTF